MGRREVPLDWRPGIGSATLAGGADDGCVSTPPDDLLFNNPLPSPPTPPVDGAAEPAAVMAEAPSAAESAPEIDEMVGAPGPAVPARWGAVGFRILRV